MFLSSGTLQSYSEQQLVDCSKMNNGCNGGLMDYAFQYIETAPLMLESEYPYTGRDGHFHYESSKGQGRSRPSRMSEETPLVLNSKLPSPRAQSLSPSRLINSPSRDTPVVSSPLDAEPSSTTVSSLSDTVDLDPRNTSSSRTPGEPHGETLDTSRSPHPSAVSPISHPTQLSEADDLFLNKLALCNIDTNLIK